MIPEEVTKILKQSEQLKKIVCDEIDRTNSLFPNNIIYDFKQEIKSTILYLCTDLFFAKYEYKTYKVPLGNSYKVIDNLLNYREYKHKNWYTFHFDDYKNMDFNLFFEPELKELIQKIKYLLEDLERLTKLNEPIKFKFIVNKDIQYLYFKPYDIPEIRNTDSYEFRATLTETEVYRSYNDNNNSFRYTNKINNYIIATEEINILLEKEYMDGFLEVIDMVQKHLIELNVKINKGKEIIMTELLQSKYAPVIMARRV
jgi:hypothetical protein